MRRLPAELPKEGVILVEIGGNDILGETSVREFAERLDQLLARVTGPGSTVAMFELPLPPLGNRFGAVQRRLAHKHGVILIPKRVLLNVLLSPETTQDSLHLNAEGHRRLAKQVQHMLREDG